jgi:hypothetical protein
LIEISGGVNLLDAYYFVKNYTNVAEQFELIDYSHNPLIFCNSLLLIRLLLSVTESERAEGAFHMKLLSTLNLDTTAHITCNPNSTTFLF